MDLKVKLVANYKDLTLSYSVLEQVESLTCRGSGQVIIGQYNGWQVNSIVRPELRLDTKFIYIRGTCTERDKEKEIVNFKTSEELKKTSTEIYEVFKAIGAECDFHAICLEAPTTQVFPFSIQDQERLAKLEKVLFTLIEQKMFSMELFEVVNEFRVICGKTELTISVKE